MSATGSFDHRAIDGADGAKLMQAFKRLVENPLGMLAEPEAVHPRHRHARRHSTPTAACSAGG